VLKPDPDAGSHRDANSDTFRDSDSHRPSYRNPIAVPVFLREPHPVSYCNAHADSNRDALCNCDTNTKSNCDRDTNAKSNGDTFACPGPGLEYLNAIAR
jgi:hypothetical protein